MWLLVPTALAEGMTAADHPGIVLLESTLLYIDIRDHSIERIKYYGEGDATLFTPDGTFYQFLADEELSASLPEDGRWQLILTEDQPPGWDVRVVDFTDAGLDEAFGRLHSLEWRFAAEAEDPLSAEFFVRFAVDNPKGSGDSALFLAALEGVVGDEITLSANDIGDNRIPTFSVPDDGKYAPDKDYALYLSEPDGDYTGLKNLTVSEEELVYTGDVGETIIVGTNSATFSINLPSDGAFVVACDTNGDGDYSLSGAGDVVLYQPGNRGVNTITWDGTDASGAPVPDGAYDCVLGMLFAPVHFLVGNAGTAWPGVQLFHIDGSGDEQPTSIFWNDALLLDAMGDTDGVALPSGGNALAHVEGADGLRCDPDGEAEANVSAHGWGNYTEPSRGDEGWVNTWSTLGGDNGAVLTVHIGERDTEPPDTGDTAPDSGSPDTDTPDSGTPPAVDLFGSFRGGACRCSSAPAAALLWPLLVAIAARQRRR